MRIPAMATLALCACVRASAADGRITTLTDKLERDADGTRYRLIRIEAERRDGSPAQFVALDIQARDPQSVRYATVRSSGGTIVTSSATSKTSMIWLVRCEIGDMYNAKLSYEARLADERTGIVFDTRTRGVTQRAAWDAANKDAVPLKTRFQSALFGR